MQCASSLYTLYGQINPNHKITNKSLKRVATIQPMQATRLELFYKKGYYNTEEALETAVHNENDFGCMPSNFLTQFQGRN